MRSQVVVVALLASCSHSASNLRTEAAASSPATPSEPADEVARAGVARV